MKLAAQADFYIKHYGQKAGVQYLKDLGYESIIYTAMESQGTPFVANGTDEELKKYFCEVRKATESCGMTIPFVTLKNELYSDVNPDFLEKGKRICLKAIKATAYMGSDTLGIQPVCLRKSTPDAFEKSKAITYQIFEELQKEADKVGVRLAVINNTKQRCFSSGSDSYGCRAEELLELAQHFNTGVILNPVHSLKAGERVPDMIETLGERLIGLLLIDASMRTMSQGTMPLMGAVDYFGIAEYLQKKENSAVAAMLYTPIMDRYRDFVHVEGVIDSLSKLFFDMSNCIIGNGNRR